MLLALDSFVESLESLCYGSTNIFVQFLLPRVEGAAFLLPRVQHSQFSYMMAAFLHSFITCLTHITTVEQNLLRNDVSLSKLSTKSYREEFDENVWRQGLTLYEDALWLFLPSNKLLCNLFQACVSLPRPIFNEEKAIINIMMF